MSSISVGDGTEAKIPEIPDNDEIREILREKSPVPDFSIALFEAFLAARRGGTLARITGPTPITENRNQVIPLGGSANAIVTQHSASIGSTGHSGFDEAVAKLHATASNMAFQAALYDSLRGLSDGSIDLPAFGTLERYFRSLEDERGDDGHFYRLNRDFLIVVALEQYRSEVEIMVNQKLTEFARNPKKLNAKGFREAIAAVPVEGREVVWRVAKDPTLTKREFLGVQEGIRNRLAIEHLPKFIDHFVPEDFGFVISLISGNLRDLKISVPVVQWCLNHARSADDLLLLLDNELADATYIRFPRKELNDPKANPFGLPARQNDPGVNNLPEEPFFTDVFFAILRIADQKFQVSRGHVMRSLARHTVEANYTGMAFRFETLLHHVEFVLGMDDKLEEWDPILIEMRKLLLEQGEDEASPLHSCREEMADRIQTLREEVVVRQKGWVPISETTFTGILEIIHNNQTSNGGRTPEDPRAALELAAAKRALIELSQHVLTGLNTATTEEGSRFLTPAKLKERFTGCLKELVQVWSEIEDNP